jgi:hypothetical protein
MRIKYSYVKPGVSYLLFDDAISCLKRHLYVSNYVTLSISRRTITNYTPSWRRTKNIIRPPIRIQDRTFDE